MFAKKASFKQSTAIKGSERKSLLARIDKEFPLEGAAELKNTLVPKTIQSAKCILHSGAKAQVYSDDGRPLWVIVQDTLVPTVLTLARVPALAPVVHTPANTLGYLQNGADFMIPGIFGELPTSVGKGDAVQIRSLDGDVLAVGISLLDFANMTQASGKAVTVVNVAGDTLTPEAAVRKATKAGDAAEGLAAEGEGQADAAAEPAKAAQAEPKEDDEDHLTENEVDEAFVYALDKSLRISHELPLPLATFATTLQAHLPYSHPDLVVKNSQWGKLAGLMKAAEKDGKLKLKDRQGDLVIQSIDAAILAEAVPEAPARQTRAKAPKPQRMEAREFFRPRSIAKDVLGEHDVSGYYTPKQLTAWVGEYIEAHKLGRGAEVDVDDALRRALGLKQDIAVLKRAEVMPAFLKNANVFHTITAPDDDPDVRPKMVKGAVPTVSVGTERRGGNKTVTKITGVEAFGLDPKATAEVLRHKCASSATVSESRTGPLVLVQGNHVAKVVAALEERGLRPAWIKAGN